jgi:hypothetical protein
MVGLCGLISYSVSRRTREMGIRIALGAPLRAVRGMVVGDGFRVAGTGVVVGTWRRPRSLARSESLLRHEPERCEAASPGALVLIGVALLASYLPARRRRRWIRWSRSRWLNK